MHRVANVAVLDNYQLHVRLKDGTEGTVSIADRLFGPVFEPLREAEVFQDVTVDEFGAICWPNGADLAPDALYERIRATTLAKDAISTSPRPQ